MFKILECANITILRKNYNDIASTRQTNYGMSKGPFDLVKRNENKVN